MCEQILQGTSWKSSTIGHEVVISYFVGVGRAVELLRLGDK